MRTQKSIEEEVQTFTDEELRLWNKGYLSAVEGFIEQLNSDQIRLLNKIMSINAADDVGVPEMRLKRSLEARLSTLDLYEEHYRQRLAQLERDAE